MQQCSAALPPPPLRLPNGYNRPSNADHGAGRHELMLTRYYWVPGLNHSALHETVPATPFPETSSRQDFSTGIPRMRFSTLLIIQTLLTGALVQLTPPPGTKVPLPFTNPDYAPDQRPPMGIWDPPMLGKPKIGHKLRRNHGLLPRWHAGHRVQGHSLFLTAPDPARRGQPA